MVQDAVIVSYTYPGRNAHDPLTLHNVILHQLPAGALSFSTPVCRCISNKKHLKNVGPIRHCEPPHAACFTLPFTRCRYCRTPPAHRCPRQHRQQRQRVTEGTAMALWNGPNNSSTTCYIPESARPAIGDISAEVFSTSESFSWRSLVERPTSIQGQATL